MIGALLALGIARAGVVSSTADTNVAGTLRWELDNLTVGETVTFSTTTFPPGVVTPITLTTPLPVVTKASVILDGDLRVRVQCAAAMTTGSALVAGGVGMTVRELILADCPDQGLVVQAADILVADNELRGNDKFGILVTGLSAVTYDVEVTGNLARDNCNATTASCAGIAVRRGTGVGGGPLRVEVRDNTVDGTRSSGHGIALLGGADLTVEQNIVGQQAGNAGHGILCAAQSGLTAQGTIAGNRVVNNTLAGIQLGARCNPSTVFGNWVGTDGWLDLGNGGAGIEVFASDGHDLDLNLVSGNGTGGILVSGALNGDPADHVTIENNVVGLSYDSATVIPNTGAGIRLDAAAGVSVFHSLIDNVVSGNTGDGISINAQRVDLFGNLVGTNPAGAALGNAGHGMYIGAIGDETVVDGCRPGPAACTPNVLADNGLSGLQVFGSDVTIRDNLVGWAPDGVTARGNDADGVNLRSGDRRLVRDNRIGNNGQDGIELDPTGGTAADDTLLRNTITANVLRGIRVATGASRVRWSRNEVSDNGSCPFSLSSSVNGAAAIARPTISVVTPVSMVGAYTVPVGLALDRIELFADSGTELGRYLGTATTAPPPVLSWTYALPDAVPLIPTTTGRVTAIALFTNNESSHPEEWCQDGCDIAGAASCNDGSICTSDTCTPGGCTHGTANNGFLCNDGNACASGDTCSAGQCEPGPSHATVGTTCNDADPCTFESTCDADGHCDVASAACDDGNPCTSEGACDPVAGCDNAPQVEGFACDDGDACTEVGTCDGAGTCEGTGVPWGSNCPEATACNSCICDPDHGCICEGVCGDGICGPDDLWVDTDNDGDRDGHCAECELNGDFDTDADGYPDRWEQNGVDLDCSGTIDVPRTEFRQGQQDLLFDFDYMAPGTDVVCGPFGCAPVGHDHFPESESLDRMRAPFEFRNQFKEAAYRVEIIVGDEIPHEAFTMAASGATPAALGDGWRSAEQLTRAYGRGRGVYRHLLAVHSIHDHLPAATGVAELRGDLALLEWQSELHDNDHLGFHEIGHLFGLRHSGGPGDSLDRNCEVNYPSAMNYCTGTAQQRPPGIGNVDQDPEDDAGDQVLDYSPVDLEVDLDEVAGVVEADGVTAVRHDDDELYLLTWACKPSIGGLSQAPAHPPGGSGLLSPAERALDFDCNTRINASPVTHDLAVGNPDPEHTGQNDWANLRLAYHRDPYFYESNPEVNSEVCSDQAPQLARPPIRIYPGCSATTVPLTTSATWRIPIVVYGSTALDVTTLAPPRLVGVAPWSTEVRDLDDDGFDDAWYEFRRADLTMLASDSVVLHLYTPAGPGPGLVQQFPIAMSASPNDPDLDGLHNACDACPLQGYPRGPDGCPLGSP